MKELCLTEEVLQQFVDGELAPERLERAASHLSQCAACTNLLGEVEQETALLSEAFAPELGLSVPTARLRERLDAAIADLEPQRAFAGSAPAVRSRVGDWLRALSSVFTPQRGLAFAGLAAVMVFASIVALIQLRQERDAKGTVAATTGAEMQSPSTVAPVTQGDEQLTAPVKDAPSIAEGRRPQPPRRAVAPKLGNNSNAVARSQPQVAPPAPVPTKLLPGEKSYLEAIATLTEAIETNNQVTLKPTVRADFERSLAVVDQAIATTRMEAKRNPADRDAAEFMFTAYQNKIELLSAVAYQGRASR